MNTFNQNKEACHERAITVRVEIPFQNPTDANYPHNLIYLRYGTTAYCRSVYGSTNYSTVTGYGTSRYSGVARDHVKEVVDFILVKHPDLS